MASLFRPRYTKNGITKICRVWWGQWSANGRTFRKSLKTTNKTAAQIKLGEMAGKVARGDFEADPPNELPLSAHLEGWQADLAARDNTPGHVALVVGRVRKLLTACKFIFPPQIDPSAVSRQLKQWRSGPERMAVQTSNHYLTAIKGFSRWLSRATGKNPLSHLQGGNVGLDRRHERRELSDQELSKLFEAALKGEPFDTLTGFARMVLYQTALYTGLRASELASLTPESFELSASPPTVSVDAGNSKRRRLDTLPIHPSLLTVLVPFLATFETGELLWPGTWAKNRRAGRYLQADLKAAGIPYADESGHVADFHALRHTFISRLVRSGVKPKEAQTLARHSTITLTMDRYAHVGIADSAAAIAKMPGLETCTNLAQSAQKNDSQSNASGRNERTRGKGSAA